MAHSLSLSPIASRRMRYRRFALAVVLWAFGLSTTTLLVGVWGRSVATDQTRISASVTAALDPETIASQIADWLATGAVDVSNMSEADVEEAVLRTVTSPAVQAAVQSVVEDVVAAASAPPGSSTVIDLRPVLDPLRAELGAGLAAADIEASPAQVDTVLEQVEELVLTSSEPIRESRAVTQARDALTVVMIVGAACLLLFGGVAVRLSGEPLTMLRSLANRLVVSAITFALFLRISAWAVDPGGGRSPIRASGAVLLDSNQGIIWVLALAGVVVSVAAGRLMRRRRRARRSSAPPSHRVQLQPDRAGESADHHPVKGSGGPRAKLGAARRS